MTDRQKPTFPPGMPAGEINWTILQAAKVLTPLAPVAFLKRGLDGAMTMDADALLDAATQFAALVATKAVELADHDEEKIGGTE